MLQDYGKKKFKISDFKIVNNFRKNKNKSKDTNNIQQNNFLINKIVTKNLQKGFQGVSIHSKSIKKGNLFIAIKGKNNDGHNYVKEAFFKGANYCIVSKNTNNFPKSSYKVSNTYNFLKRFAILKRNHLQSKIIAVTGSSGKTTVKDLQGSS